MVTASLGIAAAAGAAGWLWQGSLVAGPISVLEMGTADHGHGAHGSAGAVPATAIDQLIEPDQGQPDVRIEVVARSGPGGLTFNGSSPGPVIRAEEGQLLEVSLRNESVAAGTTIHWHGVEVPNAMDGVAGVTQDAVPVGGRFSYRFRAQRAGTYWYHSHQNSHEQVEQGLFGALVIEPRGGSDPAVKDLVMVVHGLGEHRTINGRTGVVRAAAEPGDKVRVRVVNTENGEISAWVSGAPFRLAAIDASEVNAPQETRDRTVQVTAGGRADLELVVPPAGALVDVGGAALQLGPAPPAGRRPRQSIDPLSYGLPAPVGFDPGKPQRRFEYAIGLRPGFVRGKPGAWWTINGRLYPDMPMFMVRQGEVVRVEFTSSNDVHPMHLHGHRMLVLSRNGVPATGSPWWVDSLDLARGEAYEVAFVADNPGIWPFHCHNLEHAADGLVAHLMYESVDTPFRIGDGNEPE